MIGDLLDANRIRSGEKIPLDVELVDLLELAKTTLKELSQIHGDRFILKSPDHIKVYCDPKAIRRAIENLCGNAIKYGDPKAPVSITLKETIENAFIEVQNKGELISLEDQKFLFQQFRRGRNTQSSGKKGWGIGLTLVHGIADAHGGSVHLKSEIEAGTVFEIILPLDARPFLTKENLQ